MVCPACRRIEDRYEGGIVFLEGGFLVNHKSDILNIIKNVDQAEKKQRPLEKILSVTDEGNKLIIKTTYEHIDRKIGQAVHNAYKGDLKIQCPEGQKYARVHWIREA